ncbi:MAG: hypothetical protein HY721_28390 [Planctomycetes bacterium]|nr:hypothetical protein [Planctomycetota bacterium]
MPAHDWTKVGEGIFHHFRNAWLQELADALNGKLLPPNYYALTEQQTRKAWPDKTIAIHHVEEHDVVAHIVVLSRASKATPIGLDAFLAKTQWALKQGIHLLLVDLYPPGLLDPSSVHGELWAALGAGSCQLPEGKGLIAAAYQSAEEVRAHVEPFRVGDALPAMPVFLDVRCFIRLPLEPAYEAAFQRVPRYWREKILE